MRTRANGRRRRSGNTLVEFAVAFFMIFAVFAGTFQFGYSFFTYNLLVNAVRDGARYAANKPYDSLDTTPSRYFQSDVQNMVVYGNPSPPDGARPIVSGLTPDNVQIMVTGGPSGGSLVAPVAMTIAINNYTIDAVFARFLLNGRPNATFPYTGLVVPAPPTP